jgi:hypothetical protein
MKTAIETGGAVLKRGLPEDVVAETAVLEREIVRKLKEAG